MHSDSPVRRTSYFKSGRPGIIAIASALLIASFIASGVSARDTATPVTGATPAVVENICDATASGVDADPWIRTELFFGTSTPDGDVSDGEWIAFLDDEITPRFPEGLTVLEGYGQFLNARGDIVEEDSIVVVILYPDDALAESSAAIEDIRDRYEIEFDQESVLRVDSEPVCVSF